MGTNGYVIDLVANEITVSLFGEKVQIYFDSIWQKVKDFVERHYKDIFELIFDILKLCGIYNYDAFMNIKKIVEDLINLLD